MADIATLGIKVLSDDIVKATKRLDALEKKSGKVEKTNKKLGNSFGALKGAIAAVGIGLLTKKLISSINTYTALNNKLKLVTTSAKNLADVQGILFDVAQETRGSLEGTIDLYSKLARSTRDLGLSQNDLADVTETINKAIAVSGATANEANAAIFQLGQGLSAGALRGEELNSVMEQTPRLAQALADGLGVGIAELRKMGSEGKLNSEIVIKALQNQAAAIDDEFSQTAKTVSQAFQQIENVALKTFGSLDSKELIASLDDFRKTLSDPAIVEGLQGMASALLTLATALVKVTSGLGTFFKNLSEGGENFGKFLANIGRTDISFQFEELNKEIAILERIQERATVGSGMWKNATDKLTESYKRLKEIKDELGISTDPAASAETEAPDTGGGAGAGGSLVDKSLSGAQETALQNLKDSYASQETLLIQKYTKDQELLFAALEAGDITRQQFLDLQFESEIELFDKQQELVDMEAARDEEILLAKQEYYERLYNMQTGSLAAGADFAKAIRDGDAKSALDNGSLMLSNLSKTSKAAFEVQKAFSLAKAITTLPSAIIDSFNNGGGYPWGIIPAALMAAQGAQQIAAIKSSTFGGGSVRGVGGGGGGGAGIPTGGGLPDGATATPDGKEVPKQKVEITLNGIGYSKEDVRMLIDQINEERKDGVEMVAV